MPYDIRSRFDVTYPIIIIYNKYILYVRINGLHVNIAFGARRRVQKTVRKRVRLRPVVPDEL